jgi:hypothetical protein
MAEVPWIEVSIQVSIELAGSCVQRFGRPQDAGDKGAYDRKIRDSVCIGDLRGSGLNNIGEKSPSLLSRFMVRATVY